LTDFSARLAGINVGAPARPEPSGDFGLIGLAVMGQNLILNAADHGFTVVAYNRTVSKVDRFLANEAKGMYNPEQRNHLEANKTQASPSSVLTPSKSSAPS
jgi:6-phosphogluconate dehydrogenase